VICEPENKRRERRGSAGGGGSKLPLGTVDFGGRARPLPPQRDVDRVEARVEELDERVRRLEER